MAIDPKLLEILVCPVSHAPLREVNDSLISTDAKTRLRYRIDDNVPVMLVEEAVEMSEADWTAAMGDV